MTQPAYMPQTRQNAPERAEEPKQAAGVMSSDGERTQDNVGVLTPREREVYELVLGGLTNAEIAQRLYIEKRTVKNYLWQIRRAGCAMPPSKRRSSPLPPVAACRTERQRQVVELARNGLDNRQIAVRMGLSVQWIKNVLYQARAQYREAS